MTQEHLTFITFGYVLFLIAFLLGAHVTWRLTRGRSPMITPAARTKPQENNDGKPQEGQARKPFKL